MSDKRHISRSGGIDPNMTIGEAIDALPADQQAMVRAMLDRLDPGVYKGTASGPFAPSGGATFTSQSVDPLLVDAIAEQVVAKMGPAIEAAVTQALKAQESE